MAPLNSGPQSRLQSSRSPPNLLIVGASCRAAAQSARRAGYVPWTADSFGDQDLLAIAQHVGITDYPDGLLRLWPEAPQAPWLYTGALENYPDLVDQLAQLRPLLGNSGSALRRLRDIGELDRLARQVGLALPTMSMAPSRPAGNWLRKSRRSAGGLRVRDATALESPEQYWQRRIDGAVGSVTLLAHSDRCEWLGATRQLAGAPPCGAPPFHYCGSVGPWQLPPEVRRSLLALGEQLTCEVGARGLFGIDFILDEHGAAWPLEVNPRYTASMEILERAQGRQLLAEHIRACGGEPPQADATELSHIASGLAVHGKVVVYAPASVVLDDTTYGRLNELAQSTPWPLAADLPTPGAELPANSPVCTLFGQGDSVDCVIQQLLASAAAFRASFMPR